MILTSIGTMYRFVANKYSHLIVTFEKVFRQNYKFIVRLQSTKTILNSSVSSLFIYNRYISRQTKSSHRIAKSSCFGRQFNGNVSLHRARKSNSTIQVIDRTFPCSNCESFSKLIFASHRWFANTLDLTSLTSSTINVPLSKHVHNHSIGCMATNAVGSTNSSIRLLIRCKLTFIRWNVVFFIKIM